ncbi:Na+/H+ antiporter [Peribacillus sp. SCS-37]|uniref:Na+/H+ antiporter n=1 Tax=Paraperibacillus esterisolvens TaxID=3115296 RepID=UPI003906108A
MDILMTVLLLLVCLLISNIISHYIQSIPEALIQIGLGVLLTLLYKDVSFELETEWFLLLFVAPLLYNDGRHFPREELWKMRAPILGNAIILVLLTTIAGGYFVHWLIPAIPVAAALALAAILSPTDPVAVNGIAKRVRLPNKVLNLVRGESLINDASGLVAFNYAVAAVVTGYFSLKSAVFDFTYMFIAGAILGLVLGFLITWFRFTLRQNGIEDVIFHSLLQIMTPFLIFIITEKFLHASGVIAVVVAGIVHALVKEHTETMVAEEQVLTENIWSMISFILNGIVFLLLGLNIPSSIKESVKDPNIENWQLVGYAIAISVAILGIRFVWAHLFAAYEYHTEQGEKPTFRTTLMVSLTGVRGSIAMAGVLSIPMAIDSGADFPERSLILFLAAGVILFTLIAATILLPILSKEESSGEQDEYIDIDEAKKRLLIAGIRKLHSEVNEENETAAYELIEEYKFMFQQVSPSSTEDQDTDRYQDKMNELRLEAIKTERDYIEKELEDGDIDQETYDLLQKFFDYREEALSRNAQSGFSYLIGKMVRAWRRFRGRHPKETEAMEAKWRLGQSVQMEALQAALDHLEGLKDSERKDMVNVVILDYERMINRLKAPSSHYNTEKEEEKEELRIRVMDLERSKIRTMLEAGEISRNQAKELRRFINYHESITLQEYTE